MTAGLVDIQTEARQASKFRRLRAISWVLCGEHVEHGKLLNHKAVARGEQPVVAAKVRPRSQSAWAITLPVACPALERSANRSLPSSLSVHEGLLSMGPN